MENFQTQTLTKTKSGVATKVGIGLLVVVFGVAGSAFSFIRYARTPEARILESMNRLTLAKSVQYEGNILVKGQIGKASQDLNSTFGLLDPSAGEVTNFNIDFRHNGKFQKQSEKKYDFSNSLIAKVKTDKKEYPPFLFDHQNVKNISYVRFPSLPALLGIDLEFLNSQWISFDFAALEQKIQEFRIEQEAKPEIQAQKKESQKIIEALTQVVAVSPPIRVTKTLRAEKINGVVTTPYVFVINQKNAIMIMNKLLQNEKYTGVTKYDVENWTEMLLLIEKFEGKIWVGQKNILPYKVEINFRYNDETTGEPLEFKIQYAMKNFDTEMKITAPENAMSFEDALKFASEKMKEKERMMNPPNLDSSTSTTQQIFDEDVFGKNKKGITPFPQIDSDNDGLFDEDEVYFRTEKNNRDTDGDRLLDGREVYEYHTNPLKKDTDGDGYDDAMEVKSGHDPLKKAK